jgi:DnaJ-class molecular chaperone
MELRIGNEKVTLDIPAGCQDGQQVVFRGMGKPYRTGRGDLSIIIRVIIPRRLSKRERELYEELKRHS